MSNLLNETLIDLEKKDISSATKSLGEYEYHYDMLASFVKKALKEKFSFSEDNLIKGDKYLERDEDKDSFIVDFASNFHVEEEEQILSLFKSKIKSYKQVNFHKLRALLREVFIEVFKL